VLDNLPRVPPEKYEKLAGVVRKIVSQVGVTIREGKLLRVLGYVPQHLHGLSPLSNLMVFTGGFFMPVDEETKLSKGFAFIEFTTPEVSVLDCQD
jgi:translation initiation factor 3 subunit B